MTGNDVVREAREWVGTPFHWQASLKGVGCDCKGLVWGVARSLGLPEAESVYAKVADYQIVEPRRLLEGMRSTFRRVSDLAMGRVVVIEMGGRLQHLGIVTPQTLIHCTLRPPQQVVETPLTQAWRRRIASVWAWPSLED